MKFIQIFQAVSFQPHWSCLLDMCQSVLHHGYNVPFFVYIKYIQIIDARKYIINIKEFLILSWFLECLCALISCPSLSWFMSLPPFSLFLQLTHSLFVLVFLLLYLYHASSIHISAMFETFTLNCFHCLLGCSDDIPVRHIFCIGYLFSFTNFFQGHDLIQNNYTHVLALKWLLL